MQRQQPKAIASEFTDIPMSAYQRALADPEVQDKLRAVGAIAGGGKPDVLARMIEKDLTTYRELAQAFDIRAD